MSFSIHNNGLTGSFPHGAAKRKPVVIEGSVIAKEKSNQGNKTSNSSEPFQQDQTHSPTQNERVVEAQAARENEQLLGSKRLPKAYMPYGAVASAAHNGNSNGIGGTIDTYA